MTEPRPALEVAREAEEIVDELGLLISESIAQIMGDAYTGSCWAPGPVVARLVTIIERERAVGARAMQEAAAGICDAADGGCGDWAPAALLSDDILALDSDAIARGGK